VSCPPPKLKAFRYQDDCIDFGGLIGYPFWMVCAGGARLRDSQVNPFPETLSRAFGVWPGERQSGHTAVPLDFETVKGSGPEMVEREPVAMVRALRAFSIQEVNLWRKR
jgi:hypothetical protein